MTQKDRARARTLALSGDADVAITLLAPMAESGDAGAAASLAELLAFKGRWSEVIGAASLLLAEPQAVYAGNVFTDMVELLGRAGHETRDWTRIAAAAAHACARVSQRGDPPHLAHPRGRILAGLEAYAAREGFPPHELIRIFGIPPSAPDAASHRNAVEHVFAYRPDLRGDPSGLAEHLINLAISFRQWDALLERFAEEPSSFRFQHAVPVARALVERQRLDEAWAALEPRLGSWWPVDRAQVAPVELLTDPQLRTLMTVARSAQVLATPRGPGAL
jgi:hypothetical protein